MKKNNFEYLRSWKIEGILFDFDGTLTMAGLIDFKRVKEDVGCPHDMPVLEFIESIVEDDERFRAFQVLEEAEEKAALNSLPNEGACDVIQWIRKKKIPCGILTRNSHINVERALKNFESIEKEDFSCIISRDNEIKPKPHEEGVFLAAQHMGIETKKILVVGDYHFDIEAGKRAGALTSFITNGSAGGDTGGADFVVTTLEELVDVVEMGLPLDGGKLPYNILESIFKQLSGDRPDVIVGPGTGEDTAVVDPGNDELISVTSDPVTFTTEAAGRFSVHVNANDIAASGAEPKWFMMTLLMPAGSSASEAVNIILEADEYCKKFDVSLCGGHTEFTDAVNRPVVSGTMIGTVRKGNFKKKNMMKEGDLVLMTRTAGVEGTALIALNFEEKLLAAGIDPGVIKQGKEWAECISVMKEAEIAVRYKGVTAMHDVTEGGIATALDEFSAAGGHRLKIDKEAIPVADETEEFCSVLGLDPLGLIGSGALLIAIDKSEAADLTSEIEAFGTRCSIVGTVGPGGRGVSADKWPSFDADEITKLFAGSD